ncbi:BcepNY3gp20 [Burkholderia phage BcepNY3]|uniref:BcepNY3gp20 n=1 Tax=Burkholderia phage BcepNY3 TaxID=2881397 RepID=A6N3C8_9CAUD|nr:BcepNY3gp20 [Burkholderia phage BcepNY3]ABR10555.1 BcepNY3gp20 [Burkholderia phage BcepNY3]
MSTIDKLAGYEAILTHHSIITPQINKLKPTKPAEFYALIALPAAAQADLWAILCERATSAFGHANNFEHGIKTNATSKKPIAGVPGDALVVRAASQYAPEIYDADGTLLNPQNPAHLQTIKAKFFAGTRVRTILTPFHWTFQGRNGVSFNLAGIMLVPSEAQRLAIGGVDTASAFKKFAQPGTGGVPATAGAPTDAAAAFAAGGNPDAAGGTLPANPNPFAQQTGSAAGAGGNPFL